MARGRFITFEGGEGAGKSTQAARLAARLEARRQAVVLTREPGGSPESEAIRRLLLDSAHDWAPLSEALLHAAARREHLRQTIRPALARGAWVICDRFADSTVAYQGYGQGLDLDTIACLQNRVVEDTWPDLTFVLDLPPAAGIARVRGRGAAGDRYEAQAEAFHARVRQGFVDIAARAPERCIVIDATRPAETVGASVWRAIEERLGPVG